MTDESIVNNDEETRHSRRRLLLRAAGSAGLLAIGGTGVVGLRQATAKDDDDDDDDDDDNIGHGGGGDDNSGHGSGGDDHDTSGHGGGGDDDEPAITGEIPAGSVEVWITDDDADGFSPSDLTVDQGQSVTFINADHHEHTATGSGFDTGIMQPGQTATVTLDKPGTFAYACQIHPVMTGSVSVRDENGEVPAPSQSASTTNATPCQITNFAFDPPVLSVAIGTTVSWTNADSVPHTVTATDGTFDSGIFDPGASFAWEFTTPGTFAYICNLHPQMQGTVEVTGDAPATQDEPRATPVAGGLVGSWDVALTPEPEAGLTPRRATVTFHDDGTLEAIFAPPENTLGDLPYTLGPAHGTWTSADNGFLALTTVVLLDDDDRFAGILNIREEIQIADSGDGYSGSFTFVATEADGVEAASGDGTTEAVRLDAATEATPEPLPLSDATPPANAASPDEVLISILDFSFDPTTVEIPAGTTVTWINDGEAPHTATSEDGAFDTDRIDPGGEASFTFDQPGTYTYVCAFHPQMVAAIVVT